jgi:hypothetical protein
MEARAGFCRGKQTKRCEKPLGGLDLIDLADGNRLHVERLDCMIEFGRRWRGDAHVALVAVGLETGDVPFFRVEIRSLIGPYPRLCPPYTPLPSCCTSVPA